MASGVRASGWWSKYAVPASAVALSQCAHGGSSGNGWSEHTRGGGHIQTRENGLRIREGEAAVPVAWQGHGCQIRLHQKMHLAAPITQAPEGIWFEVQIVIDAAGEASVVVQIGRHRMLCQLNHREEWKRHGRRIFDQR